VLLSHPDSTAGRRRRVREQTARAKAAAMTKQALDALEGLNEEASAVEVAKKLEGTASPVLLALTEG
jgi:hypothetical protein